jgi:hypothetical protein
MGELIFKQTVPTVPSPLALVGETRESVKLPVNTCWQKEMLKKMLKEHNLLAGWSLQSTLSAVSGEIWRQWEGTALPYARGATEGGTVAC